MRLTVFYVLLFISITVILKVNVTWKKILVFFVKLYITYTVCDVELNRKIKTFGINVKYQYTLIPVASGRGTPLSPPPSEIEKMVVEIWCNLPEVYTFGSESEIQEIFRKK